MLSTQEKKRKKNKETPVFAMLSAPQKREKKRRDAYLHNVQCPPPKKEGEKKRHLSSPCSVPSRLGAGLAILEGRSSAPTTLPPPANIYSLKAPLTLKTLKLF